jgi:hypothetical protein
MTNHKADSPKVEWPQKSQKGRIKGKEKSIKGKDEVRLTVAEAVA